MTRVLRHYCLKLNRPASILISDGDHALESIQDMTDMQKEYPFPKPEHTQS